jgi:site-specific DNA recombinase
MAVRKVSVDEALRTITAADVRDACDLLAPVAQRTGRDGRFARRLEGCSLAGIARELNERGVPCPSEYDRARNSHRHAGGWSVTTIKGILENPRYTGRQVWNRQAVHHHLDDGTITGGNERERVRNARQDWVISDRPAHPALVTEADFVAVRALEG